MTRDYLPPQAYTKETLTQAFLWFQAQPDHIKALAKTQDAVVSLYMKVKRNGVQVLETLSPASQERLRQDLRSIKAAMDEIGFEEPKSEAPTPGANGVSTFTPGQNQTYSPPQPKIDPVVTTTPPLSTGPAAHTLHGAEKIHDKKTSAPNLGTSPLQGLDDLTLKSIQDVQKKLNLSSDQEAVRLLVALGFDKVRSILP